MEVDVEVEVVLEVEVEVEVEVELEVVVVLVDVIVVVGSVVVLLLVVVVEVVVSGSIPLVAPKNTKEIKANPIVKAKKGRNFLTIYYYLIIKKFISDIKNITTKK